MGSQAGTVDQGRSGGALPNPPPTVSSQQPMARPVAPVSPLAGARGDWLDVICPYLRAADGTWRSAVPAREHRCWAFEPVIELPGLTQQRLCLTQAHNTCERFVHAQERRAAALALDHIAPERLETARFGPFVSPVPLAAERASSAGDAVRALPSGRGRDRLPFLLLVGAAIVILLAAAVAFFGGFVGKAPVTGLATATSRLTQAATGPSTPSVVPLTPAPTATQPNPTETPVAATLTPVPNTPAPTATPPGTTPPTTQPPGTTPPTAPPASNVPSASAPVPTPTPVAGQRYRVKNGDKVSDLAARFGVTVRAIKLANDLGDPPVLVPGTFIIIPNPPGSPPA
jgi:LysM repeat protein